MLQENTPSQIVVDGQRHLIRALLAQEAGTRILRGDGTVIGVRMVNTLPARHLFVLIVPLVSTAHTGGVHRVNLAQPVNTLATKGRAGATGVHGVKFPAQQASQHVHPVLMEKETMVARGARVALQASTSIQQVGAIGVTTDTLQRQLNQQTSVLSVPGGSIVILCTRYARVVLQESALGIHTDGVGIAGGAELRMQRRLDVWDAPLANTHITDMLPVLHVGLEGTRMKAAVGGASGVGTVNTPMAKRRLRVKIVPRENTAIGGGIAIMVPVSLVKPDDIRTMTRVGVGGVHHATTPRHHHHHVRSVQLVSGLIGATVAAKHVQPESMSGATVGIATVAIGENTQAQVQILAQTAPHRRLHGGAHPAASGASRTPKRLIMEDGVGFAPPISIETTNIPPLAVRIAPLANLQIGGGSGIIVPVIILGLASSSVAAGFRVVAGGW